MAPLRVLVGVKRVIDYAVKVRVAAGGGSVQTQGVKHSLNPFCEIALEEGIRLKERGVASDVIAASLGTAHSQECVRTALALGADRGVLVQLGEHEVAPGPREVATALAALAQRLQPHLVLLGKQAIDDDCNQTGQILAAMLDWPQGTFVSRLEVQGEAVLVEREVDGGLERLRLRLPAVLTADLRLNQPRYATLPNIMKAKKKPLEVIPVEELGGLPPARLQILQLQEPQPRPGGQKVESVAQLLAQLRL